MRCLSVVVPLLLTACSGDYALTSALGQGTNDLDRVEIREIATAADDLAVPRDAALHPTRDELWVVNHADNSITVIERPGASDQVATRYNSMGSNHFLASPSAIAFNPVTGFFATAQEIDEPTQGPNGTPGDFVGPTLWTSDMDIFDAGHGGHMDMLHNSPNAVGVAWEIDNAYWVVDGYHTSFTRYDFQQDHGPGGADHTDGEILRYAEGEIGYLPGVSSHAVYDHDTDYLYVADAANARVVVLDTLTGEVGGSIRPNYDGVQVQNEVEGADLWTLIAAGDTGDAPALQEPSGLALHEGLLFLSDHATGVVYAFDRDGQLVDWLDTGLGEGLQGLSVDADGAIYVVHTSAESIVRLAGKR